MPLRVKYTDHGKLVLIYSGYDIILREQALQQLAVKRKRYNVDRLVKVGEKVIYHNPVGKPFEALVTAVWGPKCINIVFISGDTDRTDSFGRQIERQTSLSHVSNSPVHGQYWRFEDEAPNPIVEPLEK